MPHIGGIPDQVFGMSQGSIWFYGDGHRGRVMLLLLVRQVAVGLVQCHNALLAAHKSRTVLTQFVLNFSLRQIKSGGRFFALRLVDFFNLLDFGGDVGIEET